MEAVCPRDDEEVDNLPNPKEVAPKQQGDGELQPPGGKGGMAAAEMDFNKLDQAYLDPIPSEIIGNLEVERLLHTAVQKSPAGWIQTLKNIFTARSTDGWCGFRTKDERTGEHQQHPQQPRMTQKDPTRETGSKRIDDGFVRTRPMFSRFVQELFACGLLSRINLREKTTRFVSIFVVFKEGLKLRFIANCTRNNKSFGKPPSLLFASTESLFQALQFFGPDAFFAVADFRHWFYQIRLPPVVKHLFSLWCKGELFSFNAWPMGFSWSPFVAQGLSMTIAMLAINKSGKFAAISPRHDKGLLPDMWFVTSPDATWEKLKRRQVHAIVLFWYDNLLVIAKSEQVRSDLLRDIKWVTETHKAWWKTTKNAHGDAPTQDFTSGDNAFTCTRGEVEYLGIKFVWKSDQQWHWEHLDKNKRRWRERYTEIQRKDAQHRTWREAALLTGVIIWDWTLAGGHRRDIQKVLEVSHAIGAANISEREEWDRPAKIELAHWEILSQKIEEVVNSQTRTRKTPYGATATEERFIASDACKDKLGAVDLQTGLSYCVRIPEWMRKMHITRKETLAAMWALRHFRKKFNLKNTRFVIALDNMAAVAALNKRVVIFEKKVDEILRELEAEFMENGCEWRAVYIPGEEQPADEPSRGTYTKESKVEAAKIKLELRDREWYLQLRERQRIKRPREEGTERM